MFLAQRPQSIEVVRVNGLAEESLHDGQGLQKLILRFWSEVLGILWHLDSTSGLEEIGVDRVADHRVHAHSLTEIQECHVERRPLDAKLAEILLLYRHHEPFDV